MSINKNIMTAFVTVWCLGFWDTNSIHGSLKKLMYIVEYVQNIAADNLLAIL